MNTKKIASTLQLIVSLLSQRQFERLYDLDFEKSLPAEDISEFIDDYGGEVTIPDDGRWDYDFYPIEGTTDIFIDYDLMIDHKPSDLTLQCRLMERYDNEHYTFSIHSVHVL